MKGRGGSSHRASAATALRWLVLVQQLPTRPVSARVKTWRRLQQLGSVPLKSSVYVLPDSPQAREDFAWMKAEILAMNGQASILVASSVNETDAGEIRAAFVAARQRDYETLEQSVVEARRQVGRRPLGTGRQQLARTVRTYRDQLTQIDAIDFFKAPGRDGALAALAELERRLKDPDTSEARVMTKPPLSVRAFRRHTWVTRPRPGVDRMASAWLIRRFIDSGATFTFADRPSPSATSVPFDMFDGEFSHHGDLCTFEVLMLRFAIEDPAVRHIAKIVHDLDLKDHRYGSLEAPTIGALIEGLRRAFKDDSVLLQQGIATFEALYRSGIGAPPTPSPASPRLKRRRRTAPARKRR